MKLNWNAGSFAMALREEDAALLSLTREKQEYASAGLEAPLFSLVALDGERRRVPLMPAGGHVQEGRLVFDTLLSPDGPLRIGVTLSAACGEDELRLSLRVTNEEPAWQVVETVFLASGLTFGTDEGTALLYPHHAGEKIVNPVRTLRSERYQHFWRAYTRQVDGEWVRECNYCGLCSMSWMYLQGRGAGLYVGSHDARFPVTGLMVKTGDGREPYLSCGFRVHKRIRCGESWESGAFVLALTGKDWHDGAHRYRRWITPLLNIQENPAFLRQQAALNQCYNFKRVGEIQHRFEDIPAMWEAGNRHGINHMFIASWNRTGFDSYYPEYYPDMELGTALDFRRGIDDLNERGGFATLYVNARISDMSSDYHTRFLSRMQIENEKGEAYTETYEPHTFTLNCPSDEMWQHMLVDTCDFAAQAYHLKGIYLDQLGSAEPFACYHEGHTHQDIGEFNQGYLKVLDELLRRMRSRDPEAYLMTENCGDIYGAYTWGNLTWNGADYDEYYNLFRYTFPEYVQVNMCNDRSWEGDPARRERSFYADVERCVLMGNILWIGITSRYQGHPELDAHFSYLMEAVAFRQKIAAQVSGGVYLDDEWVLRMDETLHASCFRVAEDEALLLVGDSALQGGEVTFALPMEIGFVQAFDEHERPVAVELHGRMLTVRMEGARLACVTVERGGRTLCRS